MMPRLARLPILFALAIFGSQAAYSYYADSDRVKLDEARQRGDGVAALVPQPAATAEGEFERVPFGRSNEQTDHYGNVKSKKGKGSGLNGA